jgi:hypothetical protein
VGDARPGEERGDGEDLLADVAPAEDARDLERDRLLDEAAPVDAEAPEQPRVQPDEGDPGVAGQPAGQGAERAQTLWGSSS